MGKFSGKVIIVTGAARGLGRAAACLFAREGARVAAVDNRAEELRALEPELASQGKTYVADLANVPEIVDTSAAVVADLGGIDVLVNNAAICPRIAFEDSTEADWDRLMDVNAKSQYFFMQAVVPVMKANGGGRIVNVISASGNFGAVANASIYSGTKGAVIAFTKSVAREVAAHGITVNCFSPGTMLTDQITNLPKETQQSVREMIPLGRFTSPEEMAVNLAWVASEDCAFTTGATFDFIGGSYMR
ncbi:MAG: SDR family oxidoreductase [Candidatus Brocadiia bacterium]|jgi:NAD(P)-dependent dehydrogenase (short-subunit alcohol dehydrogenase family)|nr:SDR family oxidoreductase [Candidatus Brocadiia bacterium]MDP6775183.1 SDR family oxidoreductase [Candidatus Latescibacterota bacterium]